MKFALLALTFALAEDPAPLGSGDHVRTLKQGKVERSYLVHVPPSYDAKKPMPVVLAFHGATMDARIMVYFSGLNEKADDAGFIVVYPNGMYSTWNSGGQVLNRYDDVDFVAKLLDDLSTVLHVDTKRIYACGMSNGAMMCYRLAAEMSDRIAAIAAVSGTMAISDCKPKRPVPVIHFHGTADALVPIDGPNKKLPLLIRFKSLEQTLQTWVTLNGCDAKPETTDLPNKADDKLQVTCKAYNHGKNGAEVVLYLVAGGGHTWPGMNTSAAFLGKTTMNISANDLMWDFFRRHSMK